MPFFFQLVQLWKKSFPFPFSLVFFHFLWGRGIEWKEGGKDNVFTRTEGVEKNKLRSKVDRVKRGRLLYRMPHYWSAYISNTCVLYLATVLEQLHWLQRHPYPASAAHAQSFCRRSKLTSDRRPLRKEAYCTIFFVERFLGRKDNVSGRSKSSHFCTQNNSFGGGARPVFKSLHSPLPVIVTKVKEEKDFWGRLAHFTSNFLGTPPIVFKMFWGGLRPFWGEFFSGENWHFTKARGEKEMIWWGMTPTPRRP